MAGHTGGQTTMPEALRRAYALLAEQPASPKTANGYLDLLGGDPESAAGGPIQTLWSSGIGSTLYDHAQNLVRRLFTVARLPESALQLPSGGSALDVGCGPGTVTARLGRAVGRDGIALGLDVSGPMLERAVRAEAADNVGFLRADAADLPFPEATFDTVTSLAVLQLIPDPPAVLAEMSRVLVPGGHLVLMIPTAARQATQRAARIVTDRAGLTLFDPDRLIEILHANGIPTVHTRQTGPVLWMRARKPDG